MNFSKYLMSLNRYTKRFIVIITDLSLCIFCTWLAFCLRLDQLILFKDFNINPAIVSVVLALPIFWVFGLYKTIIRYAGSSIIFKILSSAFLYGVIYFFVISIYGLQGVPRSIGLIQPILLSFTVIGSRLFVKYLLTLNYDFKNQSLVKKKVLIYGAGSSGRQLLTILENNLEYEVAGFLDDNKELHRRVLLGQTIYRSSKLDDLIKFQNITSVFLALPSIKRKKRNFILEKLNKHNLIVKTLPTLEEIIDGKMNLSNIKDLNIDDLLNREEVVPNLELLGKNIKLKTVLVTGAGGSIGSELCRQIIRQKPNKLILLELNEFALYKVYEELTEYNKNLKIISLLVNVQDQNKIEKILETFKVDTIYHAAAYKHVPLVEENICEGVKNNVFGTIAVAKAAINQKITNLVFVSSDKAVRPTNVMGASKRLAELCIQGIQDINKHTGINFSIVRFGNVLESSGSVIPKFKKQIKEGGPITLTHPDVTRYFMTLTEAAQLVIQAGAMGKNSEVFVLDMGESVKIKDLIYKMINNSGFKVKDDKNLDGNIEIKIIGLRPGEKLYEELLIGENPKKTAHPKILTAQDPLIPYNKLETNLDILKILLNDNKADEVKDLLERVIKLYQSNSDIVDHVHVEQINLKNYKKKTSLEKENLENNVVKLER